LNLALIGYGNVARSFASLLEKKRAQYPFRIVAAHTRRGTAIQPAGLPLDPSFGPSLASIDEFLAAANAEVVLELTPLNPVNGEPAISHIRAAFARGLHVITANKGPIAHAFAPLREEAMLRGVQFRYESTVMDGVPVFNMVRAGMPGCEIRGFSAVLNSTTTFILEAMEGGHALEEAIGQARKLGITEADVNYDIDGWDAAAKTAALANVLMNAQVTPQDVDTKGIARLTPEKLAELKAKGKTVRLVSRARRAAGAVKLRVRAEVLDSADILANVRGTGNMLLLETDLLGTVGTLSVAPTIEETAYGLLSDLVDIARSL
jgi:homoserine dehydrogenase